MVSLFPFQNEHEVKISWGLDCYYVSQLKLLSNKGPAELVSEMKYSFWTSGFWAIFFFLITLISGIAGALEIASISWIPSLTVILMGIFICATFVNWYRLKTAQGYLTEPVDQDFLDKWIVYLDGVDYVRNRDEMNRIKKMVTLISKHYSLDEEEVMSLIEECFPDMSDPSGLHKFLEEKKKADTEGKDFNWSDNTKKYITKISSSFHPNKVKADWTSCFPAICPQEDDTAYDHMESKQESSSEHEQGIELNNDVDKEDSETRMVEKTEGKNV
jgi:hypothetical protein